MDRRRPGLLNNQSSSPMISDGTLPELVNSYQESITKEILGLSAVLQ